MENMRKNGKYMLFIYALLFWINFSGFAEEITQKGQVIESLSMSSKIRNHDLKYSVYQSSDSLKSDEVVSIDKTLVSKPMPTDRGRLKIVEIPDIMGGEMLKVVRTDANTPLRGASPWITKKQEQLSDISETFLKDQRDAHLNCIRLVWFQA